MKGHMEDGKFHPHTDYKKGIRKSRDQKAKTQGVIRKQRNVLSKNITASSKVKGDNIFFNQADIDDVPYKFIWNGNVFYPNGFEKDVLIRFGAKKQSEAQIEKLKKQQKFDGTNEEFLDSLRENTTRSESWLDEFIDFGGIETNPEFKGDHENILYLMIDTKDGVSLYDVTNIGEDDGFSEVYEYFFPQLDFWFKVNGKSFTVDYTGRRDYEFNPTGFKDSGTQEQVKAIKAKLEDKVFEEREAFTRKHGVERR